MRLILILALVLPLWAHGQAQRFTLDSLVDVVIQTPTSGQALKWDGTKWVNGTVASGSGTVTSVAFTLPAIFSVTGSPVTTSGTIAATLATQSANLIFAGPTTGSAASPAFRALVAADIPSLSSVYQPLDADLTYLAGFTPSANVKSILNAADYAAIKTLLGYAVLAGGNAFTGGSQSITLPSLATFSLNDGSQNLIYAFPSALTPAFFLNAHDGSSAVDVFGRNLAGSGWKLNGSSFGTLATQNGTFSGASSGTNTGDAASIPASYLDTDGTLAANSDAKVASQKAVKTYVDAHGLSWPLVSPGGEISIGDLSGSKIGLDLDGTINFAGGLGSIGTDGSFTTDGPVFSNAILAARDGGTIKASMSADGSALFAGGAATIDVSGNVAALTLTGDGSNLTGVPSIKVIGSEIGPTPAFTIDAVDYYPHVSMGVLTFTDTP